MQISVAGTYCHLLSVRINCLSSVSTHDYFISVNREKCTFAYNEDECCTTETADGPTYWRNVTSDVPLTLSDDEASFKPDVAPIRLCHARNLVILFIFIVFQGHKVMVKVTAAKSGKSAGLIVLPLTLFN